MNYLKGAAITIGIILFVILVTPPVGKFLLWYFHLWGI
jgi:hypothetical protein